MITRKFLIFWFCFTFANLLICVEVPIQFVQRNDDYYISQTNNEIPKYMKEYLKLSPIGVDFIGSSKNDTSILITTLAEHEVKWTFCRNDSFQCENKEQELSICYHNGNVVESKHEIDKECDEKNMCQIKVKLSAHENYLFNNHYGERGHSFATKKTCYIIHLYSSNNENKGHLQVLYDDYITISNGSTGGACKIYTAKLPRAEPLTYHTEIVVRQGANNDGCNIKMSTYKSHLIIKDKLIVPTSSTPTNILTTTEQSATAKFFDDWIYLIIVIVVIFIIAIIAAIIIKRKWLKKQFQKKKKCVNSTAKVLSPQKEENNGAAAFDETTPFNSNQQKNNLEKVVTQNDKRKDEKGQKLADSKPQTPATVEMKPLQVHSIPATTTTAANENANENVASSLKLSSTQASLSCDTTAPKSTVPQKTEAEMTPDELEYLAFSTSDTGKRYRIFRTAVKLAEKTAESHGFSINNRDPTVPGDEEDWLKNHADSLTKTCIEIHGIPVPDIGSTHNEHLDYIDKHSLRDIYLIALYAEVEEPTRMFFLSSVIERFREVIKQIPTKELTKAQHPLPLLLRVYDEHPEVFGVRPRRKNNDNKKK